MSMYLMRCALLCVTLSFALSFAHTLNVDATFGMKIINTEFVEGVPSDLNVDLTYNGTAYTNDDVEMFVTVDPASQPACVLGPRTILQGSEVDQGMVTFSNITLCRAYEISRTKADGNVSCGLQLTLFRGTMTAPIASVEHTVSVKTQSMHVMNLILEQPQTLAPNVPLTFIMTVTDNGYPLVSPGYEVMMSVDMGSRYVCGVSPAVTTATVRNGSATIRDVVFTFFRAGQCTVLLMLISPDSTHLDFAFNYNVTLAE